MKIDTDSVTISPQQKPMRGFEDHTNGIFGNPSEASRKGNGPRPFMGHSGPVAADSGIDRGQFSSRSVKQGPC